MICRRCDTEAGDAEACPACGLDLSAMQAERRRRQDLATGLPAARPGRAPRRRRADPAAGRRWGTISVLVALLAFGAVAVATVVLVRNAWLVAELRASAHTVVDVRRYRHVDADAVRARVARWATAGGARTEAGWIGARVTVRGGGSKRTDPALAAMGLAAAGVAPSLGASMAYRAVVEVSTLGWTRRDVIEADAHFEAAANAVTAGDAGPDFESLTVAQLETRPPPTPDPTRAPEVRSLIEAASAHRALSRANTAAHRQRAATAAHRLRSWDAERLSAAVVRFGPEVPTVLAAFAGLLEAQVRAAEPGADRATRDLYAAAVRRLGPRVEALLERGGVIAPLGDPPPAATSPVDPPGAGPDNQPR